MNTNAPPAPFIVRQQGYMQFPSGLKLTENQIVSGVAPPEFARFITTVIHTMKLDNGQQAQGKCDVGIAADTVDGAFAQLPDLVKKAAAQIEADLVKPTRPQIVLPGPPLINNGGRMS